MIKELEGEALAFIEKLKEVTPEVLDDLVLAEVIKCGIPTCTSFLLSLVLAVVGVGCWKWFQKLDAAYDKEEYTSDAWEPWVLVASVLCFFVSFLTLFMFFIGGFTKTLSVYVAPNAYLFEKISRMF